MRKTISQLGENPLQSCYLLQLRCCKRNKLPIMSCGNKLVSNSFSAQQLLKSFPECWRSAKVLVFLLLKEVGSARLRESDIHPISPKTPAPQYQPIDRMKRNLKIVEDYSRDRAAQANKKILALLLKPASPIPSNTG